ncbi:MAG: hypothetical protein H6682_13285 [Candidatus Eisenbacteria bacterium]|nr:hypothetical protein [Candidatus Eisenbacteria bacterium]
MTEHTPSWPELPVGDWIDTLETLHRYVQIVGKVRMTQSPWLNHSWSVPLYVTSSGLGTSLVPHGNEGFEIRFDFIRHELVLSTTTGEQRTLSLLGGGSERGDGALVGGASERGGKAGPLSVAAFYREVMAMLDSVGMPVRIHATPSEIPNATPFPKDEEHEYYDGDQVHTLWRALVQSERVFSRFRSGFRGKASPVHFFWGSFDLAVTRFSGRPAPPHPGGIPNFPDEVAREAYSHEVTSCGFWPGNREAPDPIFYAYAYPTPEAFAKSKVEPKDAFWLEQLGEFALPYESVRTADDPDALVMSFIESCHRAAADLAKWDRDELECAHPDGPDWWRIKVQS